MFSDLYVNLSLSRLSLTFCCSRVSVSEWQHVRQKKRKTEPIFDYDLQFGQKANMCARTRRHRTLRTDSADVWIRMCADIRHVSFVALNKDYIQR